MAYAQLEDQKKKKEITEEKNLKQEWLRIFHNQLQTPNHRFSKLKEHQTG